MPDSSPAPAHTPALWQVSKVLDHYIDDKEGNTVAYVSTSYRSKNEVQANARLIAAAPELLELCKRSLAYLTDPDPSPLEVIGFDADLKAAIAKAEGNS